MPIEQQVLIIWTATKGLVDDIAIEDLKKFEQGLQAFVENAHGGLLEKIRDQKKLDDEIETEMRAAVKEFKQRFTAEAASAQAAN